MNIREAGRRVWYIGDELEVRRSEILFTWSLGYEYFYALKIGEQEGGVPVEVLADWGLDMRGVPDALVFSDLPSARLAVARFAGDYEQN